jgi:molybdate transport system regulatory protein
VSKINSNGVQLKHALASTLTDKRIEVLRAIDQLGSISEAARSTGISYKAAWQAIETLSNLSGVPLIAKSVGGSGGGGAQLTAAGHQLLNAADRLHQARDAVMAQISSETSKAPNAMPRLAGIGLRTSMRNQLPCTVHEIALTKAAPRVWLQLPDGQRLSSRITHESLELLDLQVGMSVLVLCKATAVTIASTIVALGEINVIKGQIGKRLGLKRDGQVTLSLGSGLSLSGFAELGTELKLRQPAMAAVAESGLVIALPG